MILGIEASNIRGGGGITHLKELLQAYDPSKYAFKKIIVWAGTYTLNQLPNEEWLEKRTHSFLDKNIFFRLFWQRFLVQKEIASSNIDVLFVPGAMHYIKFKPLVTMSHNMLPFEPEERERFGFSMVNLRLRLLEKKQSKTFRQANGIIFLTNYAKDAIAKKMQYTFENTCVIAHGISPLFFKAPRAQKAIQEYTFQKPFEILYVSVVDIYKHQKSLVPVVARLRNEGFPVKLMLVGPSYSREMIPLNGIIERFDPKKEFIDFAGEIPYDSLYQTYQNADMFTFASSCENLPNILIEAMASGVPITSSNKGPMPEILKDAGMYYNPYDEESIYVCLKEMIENRALREEKVKQSYAIATQYSWKYCAEQTFVFLSQFVK